MRLAIDTSAISFMASGAPKQVTEFETGTPRTTSDGQFLYAVEVVALGDEGADVLSVKVVGEPKGRLPHKKTA